MAKDSGNNLKEAEVREEAVTDLIRQARRVHLALVLVCGALLTATVLDTTSEVERAHEELSTVTWIADAVDAGLVERYVRDYVSDLLEVFPPAPDLLRTGPLYAEVDLPNGDTVGFKILNDPSQLWNATQELRAYFGSLRDFEQFWDWLVSDPTVYVASELLLASADIEPSDRSFRIVTQADRTASVADSALTGVIVRGLERTGVGSAGEFRIHHAGTGTTITIPVILQGYGIRQAALAVGRLVGADVPQAEYRSAFPFLVQFTAGLENLPLRQVEPILANMRRGGDRERFNALGVSLPATAINAVGPWISVVVLFYFWLHLRAIRDVGFSSARAVKLTWIALGKDPIARYALYTTSVLGVPFTIAYLIIDAARLQDVGAVASAGSALAAAGALAVVTHRLLRSRNER